MYPNLTNILAAKKRVERVAALLICAALYLLSDSLDFDSFFTPNNRHPLVGMDKDKVKVIVVTISELTFNLYMKNFENGPQETETQTP